MIEPKNRNLQAVRIEIAVQICQSFPALYSKVNSLQPHFISDKERCAAETLIKLMSLEPSIRHILDFYYKRMER
jgi:hypothetical protein